VIDAQNRMPRHIGNRGFQPAEDLGVERLAADQPASDALQALQPDDRRARPRADGRPAR
jgi:monofunctional biosynthetic peptidoglycan transglycosylase